MTDLLPILVGIVLVNDFVLARFLGPCPFLGPRPTLPGAMAATLAVSVTLVASAMLAWALQAWLPEPLGHGKLQLLATTLAVVIMVPMLEAASEVSLVSKRLAPVPWAGHVMVNSSMLAAVLVSTGKFSAPGMAIVWAAGTGIAFGLTLLLYAEVRDRLASGDVPPAFRGPAIALLTGGILSLACRGLGGMLRG